MLSNIGMSTSQFIKMALKQLVRQERLPFNQELYEVNVDFNDETAKSYVVISLTYASLIAAF